MINNVCSVDFIHLELHKTWVANYHVQAMNVKSVTLAFVFRMPVKWEAFMEAHYFKLK